MWNVRRVVYSAAIQVYLPYHVREITFDTAHVKFPNGYLFSNNYSHLKGLYLIKGMQTMLSLKRCAPLFVNFGLCLS